MHMADKAKEYLDADSEHMDPSKSNEELLNHGRELLPRKDVGHVGV
jgi:hypothetical protein